MVTAQLQRTHQPALREGGGARSLRKELHQVLNGQSLRRPVRREIVDSWKVSAAFGVDPGRLDLPYDSRPEEGSPLVGAAKSVVERFAADLSQTELSVVLVSAGGRVVTRLAPGPCEEAQLDGLMLSPGYVWSLEHAGTTGLGGALASGSPLLVQGGEHFADVLTTMSTAGAPVHHPRTAQLLGTLALVCSVEATNALMLPMVTRAVREVEQRLLNGTTALDRLLQEKFLQARRRTRGPLAVVGPGALLTNAAAARLLNTADRTRLWDLATSSLRYRPRANPQFALADGRVVSVSVEAILDAGDIAGRRWCASRPRSARCHPRCDRVARRGPRAVPCSAGTASPRRSTP